VSEKSKFTRPSGWQSFYGNGKLLLSAEYFVLDGAVSLALPTKFGQSLHVQENSYQLIAWKSFDDKNQLWFEAFFSINNFKIVQTNNLAIAKRLSQILAAAQELNSSSALSADSFLQKGFDVKTELTFPRAWGLGTSSTLIYMIAEWAKVDAFVLLEKTFGGSGYDIACAGAERSILYHREIHSPHEGWKPTWEYCNFNPTFSDQLFFIYLGKKQNSREGIAHYKKMQQRAGTIEKISGLTNEMLTCTTLDDFEKIINTHESIISDTLNLSKAKDLYFQDYWGAIKSLGAWGGDFVLATSNRSEKETKEYFNKKGFEVFLKYSDLILATDF